MNWRITFYNKKVKKQVFALPENVLANFLHIAELIEEHGPKTGMPFTGSIGSGLLEICAKGKEGIARALYCCLADKELVILNAFVKKRRKRLRRNLHWRENE